MVKIIIVVVILYLVYVLVHAIEKKITDSENQALLDNSVATGIDNTSGQAIQVDLGTTADNIHTAFYSSGWFRSGWPEDDPRAMTALMNVPKSLIPSLSALYFRLYSKDLKADFSNYLTAPDYEKIQSQFA